MYNTVTCQCGQAFRARIDDNGRTVICPECCLPLRVPGRLDMSQANSTMSIPIPPPVVPQTIVIQTGDGFSTEPRGLPISGYATASFILGCLGLFCLPILFSPLAIVFAFVAFGDERNGRARESVLSLIGFVIGWLGIGILFVAFTLFFGGT